MIKRPYVSRSVLSTERDKCGTHDDSLRALVMAKQAARTLYPPNGEPAHRLPMNDHLAFFLDGGVVIFTTPYS